MKILLIATNRHKQLMSRMDARPVPIGLAYVAGHLDPDRHELKVLDLMFSEDYLADTEAMVKEFQPDLVGISLRNLDNNSYMDPQWALPVTKEVIDRIRETTKVPIVCGGPAFSLHPQECYDYLKPDVGVAGDGGEAFAQLADSLEIGEAYHRLPGMVYKASDGSVVVNGQAYSSFAVPPRLEQLDMSTYAKAGFGIGVVTKLNNNFSQSIDPRSESQAWRVIRPIEEVVAEVRDMKDRFGLRKVFFIDSGFNIPMVHAKSLCQALIDADLKVLWNSYLEPIPRHCDPEMVDLMRLAGCGLVIMKGVERGTLEEGESLEERFEPLREVCHLCEEGGLHYTFSQYFGEPGETAETVEAKLEFLRGIKPALANVRIGVRIRPGTAVSQKALEEGIISDEAELIQPKFYLEELVKDWIVDHLKEEVARHPRWNLV